MKKHVIRIGLLCFVSGGVFFVYKLFAPTRIEPGIPRYDIRRELAKIDGKIVSGCFVEGGLKVSVKGFAANRNPFTTQKFVRLLKESRTTASDLVAAGENMRGGDIGRCVGVYYLDGTTEKSLRFSTIPGQEIELFGNRCGRLVRDLWSAVAVDDYVPPPLL
jgi:hypothetical protein